MCVCISDGRYITRTKKTLAELNSRWSTLKCPVRGHPDFIRQSVMQGQGAMTAGTTSQRAREEAGRLLLETDYGRFRNCTLQHLMHPEQFTNYLKLEGNAFGEKMSEREDMDKSMITDTLGHLSPIKKSRTSGNLSKRPLYSNDYEESNARFTNNIFNYKKTLKGISEVKKKFLIMFDIEAGHSSVAHDWLLNVCSERVRCELEEMKEQVGKVELALLLHPEDVSSNRLKFHCIRLKKNPSYYFTRRIHLFEKS